MFFLLDNPVKFYRLLSFLTILIVLQFIILQQVAKAQNTIDLSNPFPDRYIIDMRNNFDLQNIPDEISFCIVDLKFDGSNIKICEFGEGFHSLFGRSEILLGDDGCVWSVLWDTLKELNLPMWIVRQCRHVRDLEKFLQIGGRVVGTFEDLEREPNFKSTQIKNNMERGIKNHTGIIMGARSRNVRKFGKKKYPKSFIDIKKKYPGVLVLGEATKKFINNKHNTNCLFDSPDVIDFKPRCKTYERRYTHKLATQIIQDFGGCEIFVIKPLKSARGYGIIMVEKKDLDSTLKLIFTGKKLPMEYRNDFVYTYWKNRRNRDGSFIVEEFAQSKSIEVAGKLYDPTMRVAFSIMHDDGSIEINFLGAFWKFPYKSLYEEGSLTEKHKSDSRPFVEIKGTPWGAVVDSEALDMVKTQLLHVLPKLYIKMLKMHYKQNI